jgi:hypothetical protein
MGFLFVGYLILHPVLQVLSLIRNRGGWRVASLVGLVLLGPFYLWSLYKVFGPTESGDLSGMLIFAGAPLALLYLAVVTAGGLTAAAKRTAGSADGLPPAG